MIMRPMHTAEKEPTATLISWPGSGSNAKSAINTLLMGAPKMMANSLITGLMRKFFNDRIAGFSMIVPPADGPLFNCGWSAS